MSRKDTYYALATMCTMLALLSSLLSLSGWIALVVGFANADRSIQAANNSALIEKFWDPSYYIVSVLSPILLLSMMFMGVWMLICFCKEPCRKYYICIHILAMAEFLITMVVLCFAGDILGQMRVLIQTGSQEILNEIGNGATIPEEAIHTIFGGALVEVICLGGAWIFYIFAHAFVQFGQISVHCT